MSRVHIFSFKIRKIFINLCIILLLGIISAVVFLGGTREVATLPAGVYYKGNVEGKNISLMINVYWGTEFIDELLDIFEQKGAKTTFFVGGMWVLDNVEMVKKIISKGHEIGNHGYKHKDQDKLNYEGAKKEFEVTHSLVKSATGIDMDLFAPPSGAYNNQTVQIAESLGYKTIMWTRDTIDWRDRDTQLIYSRATNNIKGGDLVLMHPTKNTVEALPKILTHLQEKGLFATSVSDCLA